jgi:hypothetical protein
VTTSKPYFAPLTIRGQEYSFAHLEPFKVMVDSHKVGRLVSVHVRFTTHCFTEGFDPEAHLADEPVIVDEGSRQRVFCQVRYGLSAHLPTAIQGLNQPQAKIYQTGARRNWLHSTTVQGHDGPYHIFFEIRRAPQERSRMQDIELTVESAYPQGKGIPAPVTIGRTGFIALVSNVFLGKPVATRR